MPRWTRADHKAGDGMDKKLETTRADSEPGDHHEGDRQDERDDATGLKASGGADHKDSGNMDNKLEAPRADSDRGDEGEGVHGEERGVRHLSSWVAPRCSKNPGLWVDWARIGVPQPYGRCVAGCCPQFVNG